MLGLDAGVDTVVLDVGVKLFVRHAVKLGAGDCLRAVLDDAEVLGDGHGGVDVVARDHDGADASGVGLVDGGCHLGTLGVDHAGETAERKVLLKGISGEVRGLGLVVAAGKREHA